MTNIAPRVTAGGVIDDPSWLGSQHGTDATRSGTLDAALFTAETDYPDGFIPSGTLLAKQTSSGKYGPYATGGAGGLEVAVGFLYSPITVVDGDENFACAILVHGSVIKANLPTPDACDADAITELKGRILVVV